MSRDQDRSARFVADGSERDRSSAQFVADFARIEAEVQRQFADALASAGWFRRLVLQVQIRREVARRVEKLSSSSVLYAVERE